jgi:hypothetical protein
MCCAELLYDHSCLYWGLLDLHWRLLDGQQGLLDVLRYFVLWPGQCWAQHAAETASSALLGVSIALAKSVVQHVHVHLKNHCQASYFLAKPEKGQLLPPQQASLMGRLYAASARIA